IFLPPARPLAKTPFSLPMDAADQERRRFLRRLLPGFAMVSREGELSRRTEALRAERSDATSFDALLELAGLRHDCAPDPEDPTRGHWSVRRKKGWLVPITCGFRGISPVYAPGEVPGARDTATP